MCILGRAGLEEQQGDNGTDDQDSEIIKQHRVSSSLLVLSLAFCLTLASCGVRLS